MRVWVFMYVGTHLCVDMCMPKVNLRHSLLLESKLADVASLANLLQGFLISTP